MNTKLIFDYSHFSIALISSVLTNKDILIICRLQFINLMNSLVNI